MTPKAARSATSEGGSESQSISKSAVTTGRKAAVRRHRTAIRRGGCSRPVRLALETELLDRTTTFLDFGCGHGEDIEYLHGLEIPSVGWDPVHRNIPEVLQPSDVVNLGFVVNVIEDPAERALTLKAAWKLAKQLLLVSARLDTEFQRMSQP